MDSASEKSEAKSNDETKNPNAASNTYSDLYKNVGKTTERSQSQRRELFLLEQKEKRQDFLDEKRNITELFDEYEDDAPEPMEVDMRKPRLRFTLMMSEWFSDIPDDLDSNWLVKFCPEGKRRLVIAQKNTTKCFNKSGYFIFQFQSYLPCSRDDITVFDCIYNKQTNTFFILDVLVWKSVPFIDCEAHLRNFWLRSKFDEYPRCFHTHSKSGVNFEVLNCFPADSHKISEEIHKDIQIKEHSLAFDGLIFYHKESLYVQGHTPLVTWLKPYMLPEALNVNVPQKYLEKKPKDYVNLEIYLHKKQLIVERQRRNTSSTDSVEAADA